MNSRKTIVYIAFSLAVITMSSSPSLAMRTRAMQPPAKRAHSRQAAASQTPAIPETVLATFHVKPDQLAAFLKLMPEYWAALRARNLVLPDPYLVLQGEENGKPVIVQVFSWKDHDAADHIPAQIQQYWDKMNAMVESRDGHPGIEFPEMSIVK